MKLLAELRRRNVIRVAGLYLVASWLVVQVADTLLPVFEAPAWVMRVLVNEVDRSRSITDVTARRLDIAVIALQVVVGGLLIKYKGSTLAIPFACPPAQAGR